MTSYGTLRLEASGPVRIIRLARPDQGNALNLQMAGELHRAVAQAIEDRDARAIVITGSGKMFCVGGDLAEIAAQGENASEHVAAMTSSFHQAVSMLGRAGLPVVFAVNGTAAGGGLSFCTAGDFVLASEGAKFVSAYTASGLTPDGSLTYHLARHVGLLRAKELILTNRALTAQEALAWGLINLVVPPDELGARALEIAVKLGNLDPETVSKTKSLLASAYRQTLEAQLASEADSISGALTSQTVREMLSKFVKPVGAPRI